jgi:hypothetical protein
MGAVYGAGLVFALYYDLRHSLECSLCLTLWQIVEHFSRFQSV